MVSISVVRNKGIPDYQFFEQEWDHASKDLLIIAHNSAGGFSGEFYAAVRDTKTGAVSAICVRKRWNHHDYYNFTYTVMEETSRPPHYRASARVLDKLTATNNPLANQWRTNAENNLKRLAYAKALKTGDFIKFDLEVKLDNGITPDVFRIGRGKTLEYLNAQGDYAQCQIRNWRERNFELVP